MVPWTSTIRLAARLAVQAVDVLGDDGVEQAGALERGQRLVGAVGLLVLERGEAVAVEVPEALGVAPEDVDVRDLHRVDVLPQPGAGRAEVGDPGGHGDPGAGEGDDVELAARMSSASCSVSVA